ncbi:MAG: DUF4340 domain-containing protein [Nitrospina sp.]|jgi:hypothetical protein|nr:DUF4340 domain-containing protein [Nitrospina sp.]MBT3413609.1 DUF4340 domain-containing protein [Nitrospina sp.]MBT3856097.1 DUF4340 domain-containing protein [Nitrospina sp.]MBT4388600.1 DUF4340 domain-containing protein [Nitrospina sp.]MBT4621607.1 DUF4340 domain-containing protein [Nitrospina sp.]
MKFQGTAMMAAVFLSLGLYYFFVDLPAGQKEEAEKERSEKILPLEVEQVLEFSLTGTGDPIALKRKAPHSWKLIRPLSASGDSAEVETFLSEIENLKKTRVVEENPNDLSIYGLGAPLLKIHFKFENKKEETLLFGDESPMGGNLYIKRESHPAVMMAPASRSQFEKSVYNFRDKTLLNFSTGTIKHIQIISEKKNLELKKKGEVWEISGDVDAQGDKDAIMNFLQSIQFSRVREFVDENPDSLEPYGLNPPALKLILESEQGEIHTLYLGNPKGEKGYFGKINDSKNIVLVDPKLFDALSQKAVEFLDKTLLAFEEKEILELSLRSKNETLRMVRGESNHWDILSPVKTTADLSTINSLLFDLKEARIAEFIKISLDIPKTFGLDAPRKSFSLKMKDGKTWTLQLGNETSDGQQVFASRSGESTVFSISKEAVNKLFRSLHDLRNKKLLEFKNDEVNKILIKTSDKLFELRKKESEWHLEKPEQIKTGHIGRDLIWTLKGLEFNSIVTPPLSENLAGLDAPLFTISLWKNAQEEIATLTVGKLFEPEQEYVVQTGNRQYRVKHKFLGSIPLNLKKFTP